MFLGPASSANVDTVVGFIDEKMFSITPGSGPGVSILMREGYIGRVIGKGVERIEVVEADTGLKLRAVSLSPGLKPLIRVG